MPNPTQVNRLDTLQIQKDILSARSRKLDKLIAVVHWGIEYATTPNEAQKKMADFLFRHGVDYIIGGHPHVLQPMELRGNRPAQQQFVLYSLGNFISNQRKRHTDGGLMLNLTLVKGTDKQTRLLTPAYYLTWVHLYDKDGKKHYEILPCAQTAAQDYPNMSPEAVKQMKIFVEDTQKLFKKHNKGTIIEKK